MTSSSPPITSASLQYHICFTTSPSPITSITAPFATASPPFATIPHPLSDYEMQRYWSTHAKFLSSSKPSGAFASRPTPLCVHSTTILVNYATTLPPIHIHSASSRILTWGGRGAVVMGCVMGLLSPLFTPVPRPHH